MNNEDKPTERAPMLSDDEFTDVIGDAGSQSGLLVRDFYEAKITGGELRVVKKVNRDQWIEDGCCGDSSGGATEWHGYPNFCPGCGAQIVKE